MAKNARTGISSAQLARIAKAIEAERARAARRLTALQRDLQTIVESAQGMAQDDEHDPEGATLAFERAQTVALITQAQTQLAELDAAAARMDSGEYGRCQRCGNPVATERLLARPTAQTCVICPVG